MLFESNSRIEKSDNGIRFYEQDIIFSDYVFEGDVEVDLRIDYRHPGFGIVIAEKYKGGPLNSEKAHLFKIGSNAFYAIEKNILAQIQRKENACLFAPSNDNADSNLIFTITGNNVKLLLKKVLNRNEPPEYEELGTYKLEKGLGEYFIGFYSNKGNTIRSVQYKQGTPEHWVTSIHNTHGGRISFIKNGFRFEQCINNAEIEQDDIELLPGTYFVEYEKEAIDEMFDIECFVFPSAAERKDKNFEDSRKNILKDGRIVIKEKMSVNIKFAGTNGLVRNVCIKDDPQDSFVETDDVALTIEGSYIKINLDNLSKVLWSGEIQNVPISNDYTKEFPYGVVETTRQKISLEDLSISLNKEYDYELLTESKKVSTFIEKQKIDTKLLIFDDEDKNCVKVFHNMNAKITRLILVDKAGKEIDVLHQKTFKRYVPGEITGPILLCSDAAQEPLDISASYREVAEPQYRIDLFSIEYDLQLKERPAYADLEVYGIPANVTVNPKENTIKKYASQYEQIPDGRFELHGKSIKMNMDYRKKYKAIAVRYQSAEKFEHIFTNYEREIFSGEPRLILEKDPSDSSGALIVYGCKTKPDLEYIYRIPSATMINSIDICSGMYDLIPETMFEFNYSTREVKLSEELRKKYPYFIIDYLKKNSYAINYRPNMAQYEVDISIDEQAAWLKYDMADDGTVDTRKRTAIRPDRNKFIVLRRKAGAFD